MTAHMSVLLAFSCDPSASLSEGSKAAQIEVLHESFRYNGFLFVFRAACGIHYQITEDQTR